MEPPTSSFGLLEKCRSGDQEAFAALFEKYRRRLAVLIHYKLGEEQRRRVEVDDLLQETFFAASRDLERFEYRSPGSFLRWLSRIADHAIVDALRHQGRQKRDGGEMLAFRSESNPLGAEPVDTKTPSRLLAEKQAVEALLERLNALPEEYRQAIVLAKIEGLTTQELAARLGKSREAASLLLHRAVRRFRELGPPR